MDALQVLDYVSGLPVHQQPGCHGIGTGSPLIGDVNCDGVVDSVDALDILRWVAGLPVNLPAGCPAIG